MSQPQGGKWRQQDPPAPPSVHRPNLLRAVGQGSRYILAGKLITASVTFSTLVLVVRHLPPQDYGIYGLLLALESYVSLFTATTFLGIFLRYLPEFIETGLWTFARKIIRQGIALCFLSSLGIVSLSLALFPWWAPWLRLDQYYHATAIFLLACTVHFPAQLLWQSLAALLLYKHIVTANIVQSLVRAAVVLVVLLKGDGLLGLVIAEACGYLSLFLATAVLYYRSSPQEEVADGLGGVPPGIHRQMIKYGCFHAINTACALIIGLGTDVLAVSLLFPGTLVGLYALAVRVITNLNNILPFRILHDIIVTVFFRQYTRNKNPETLQVMFLFLTKVSILALLPIVITISVFGDLILTTVFGQQYSEVHGLVTILSVALFFNILRNPLSFVLLALKRNDIVSLSRVVALYNLLGYAVFPPFLGIYGIAVATCSAAILQSVLLYYFAGKLAGVHIEWKAQRITFAWFSLLCLFLVCFRYFGASLFVLSSTAALGSIAVLWLCWVGSVFRTNERQILLEFVGNIAGRPLRNVSRVEVTA